MNPVRNSTKKILHRPAVKKISNGVNTYFILRHGETNFHLKHKGIIYPKWFGAVPPVKLSGKGKKQIKNAAEELKKRKIDVIYSSDIFRTRQTAEIVAKALGLKINFDKRLRDINLGVYHGKAKKEFYGDFPDLKKRFSKGPAGGESWNNLKKRLKNFLEEINKKHKNKNILIISHGDPLWMLEGIIKKLSDQRLIDEIFRNKKYIKMGELRKINLK